MDAPFSSHSASASASASTTPAGQPSPANKPQIGQQQPSSSRQTPTSSIPPAAGQAHVGVAAGSTNTQPPSSSASTSQSAHQRVQPESQPPESPGSRPGTPSGGIDKSKKRKRLTKACDACHKNKRRCDGFLPCSNCEFSGKHCSYSDANGQRIPPPRSRDEKEQEERRKRAALGEQPGAANTGSPPGTVGKSDLDATLKRELLMLFLTYMHPFNLVFHRPTFLYNLYQDRLPPFLLNAIYALAARFSPHPRFRSTEPWRAGEEFAEVARRMMFDDSGGENILDRPSLEVAQAMCFLVVHECGMGRFKRAWIFLGIMMRIVKDLGINDDDWSQGQNNQDLNRDLWILKETRRRTFWLAFLMDQLAAAVTGRPRVFREQDLRVYLPIDDTSFELAVGTVVPTEYLPLPAEHVQQVHSISEFGHLIRVVNVFSKVMAFVYDQEKEKMMRARASVPGAAQWYAPPSETLTDCERALNAWATSLPTHLRFNDINLSVAMMSLQGGVGAGGWCYAFMHCLAECSMFYLQASIDVSDDYEAMRKSASRQTQAIENLAVILSSLGPAGRRSPLMTYTLYVVSKWQMHTQGATEPRITAMWDEEASPLWNLNKDILMATGNGPTQQQQQQDQPQQPPPRPSPSAQPAPIPPPQVAQPPPPQPPAHTPPLHHHYYEPSIAAQSVPPFPESGARSSAAAAAAAAAAAGYPGLQSYLPPGAPTQYYSAGAQQPMPSSVGYGMPGAGTPGPSQPPQSQPSPSAAHSSPALQQQGPGGALDSGSFF